MTVSSDGPASAIVMGRHAPPGSAADCRRWSEKVPTGGKRAKSSIRLPPCTAFAHLAAKQWIRIAINYSKCTCGVNGEAFPAKHGAFARVLSARLSIKVPRVANAGGRFPKRSHHAAAVFAAAIHGHLSVQVFPLNVAMARQYSRNSVTI